MRIRGFHAKKRRDNEHLKIDDKLESLILRVERILVGVCGASGEKHKGM